MATIGRRSAVVELPHRLDAGHARPGWRGLALHPIALLERRNRMSALLNLSWRYLTWGHGGGVIVGGDPTGRFRWAVIAIAGRPLPGPSHPAVAYYEPCPQRLSNLQLDTVAVQRAKTQPVNPPLRKRCSRHAGWCCAVHTDQAEGIALAVGASLDYLKPWMAWATRTPPSRGSAHPGGRGR